ncbi:transporter substrate-binding domain-containing protein [Anaerolineales bacterium HSG24]|nr:transporter substrate-binding domain-containing protein [Anaerolineales bacterium HSG24]
MSRQRWILIILIILIGVIGVGWYYVSQPEAYDTIAIIKQRGTLRVGLDASFPPFETMTAKGEIVGLDVEIAHDIATTLGVKLQLVNIGFDGLYDALLADQVDMVISGLPYDPRWTEDVAYSSTYFNAGQLLLVRVDEANLIHAEALHNQQIAVEWGSEADMVGRQLLKKQPALTLVRQETAAQTVEMLLNQQVDGAIVDGVTGLSALPRGVKIVGYLTDEWYVVAVVLDSQDLLALINERLALMQETKQLDDIIARWLHALP